jgi:hypothetical protein
MPTHEMVGGSQDGQQCEIENEEKTGFRIRRPSLNDGQLVEMYELRADTKVHFVGYSFPNPPAYQQQFQNSLDQELFGILVRLGPIIQDLGKHFERRGGRIEVQIDKWLISPTDRALPE